MSAIRLIDRALIIVTAFLVCVIAATTVWALVFRDRPETKAEAADPAPDGGGVTLEQNFAGIGRQRAVLRGERNQEGATVIIRAVFPYNAADSAFSEELVRNTGFFRETITGYFADMTASDPRLRDETTIKQELLDLFNARLRLGKIDRLFLSEFFIINPPGPPAENP
jgi:flagellar basal body-associated protein FliL